MHTEIMPIIAYYRVSTRRQGASGLGLEAQRAVCERFCAQNGFKVVAEYQEVETGKGVCALDKRPELAKSLAHAQKLKIPLIVAKLDRLSRDVAFISGLMAKNVKFISAELGPDIEEFMLHIYASLAQKERALISERTKAALAAKRERGELLGNLASLPKAQKAGRLTQQQRSRQFASNIQPIIREIQSSGIQTYSAIAKSLNSRGVVSARGGKWHPASVARIMDTKEQQITG